MRAATEKQNPSEAEQHQTKTTNIESNREKGHYSSIKYVTRAKFSRNGVYDIKQEKRKTWVIQQLKNHHPIISHRKRKKSHGSQLKRGLNSILVQ